MTSQGKKKRCAYRPCPSKTDQRTSFFSFPKDPERAAIWLKACNREDLLGKDGDLLHKTYRLCDKHFEPRLISKGGTRPHLFDKATPTIFLHTGTDFQVDSDESIRTQPKEPCFESPVETSKSLSDSQIISDESGPTQPKRPRIEPPMESSTSLAGPSRIEHSEDSMICSISTPSSPLHSPTRGTQTPSSLTSRSPRKEKLRNKIRALRKQRKSVSQETQPNWTIEDFYAICDKFLNKPLAEIVKAQAVLKNKSPIARRYSVEYKQFSLTLYFLGPRAYSFMSKFLCLPTKRTLQRITQKLACRPGLVNNSIFSAIEIKVHTMLDLDKHCTLVIDEMALKSNLLYHTGRDELVGLPDIGKGRKEFCYAQNALVIMARGLYSNWKQPIAYFFIKSQFKASELKVVLEECVLKLTQTGLYVDALVSDMGSNFIELANSLSITPENPQKLFIRVRIFYTLKFANRELKCNKENKKNRKILILSHL